MAVISHIFWLFSILKCVNTAGHYFVGSRKIKMFLEKVPTTDELTTLWIGFFLSFFLSLDELNHLQAGQSPQH